MIGLAVLLVRYKHSSSQHDSCCVDLLLATCDHLRYLLNSLWQFARWSAQPCLHIKARWSVQLARITLEGVDDHGEIAMCGKLSITSAQKSLPG